MQRSARLTAMAAMLLALSARAGADDARALLARVHELNHNTRKWSSRSGDWSTGRDRRRRRAECKTEDRKWGKERQIADAVRFRFPVACFLFVISCPSCATTSRLTA